MRIVASTFLDHLEQYTINPFSLQNGPNTSLSDLSPALPIHLRAFLAKCLCQELCSYFDVKIIVRNIYHFTLLPFPPFCHSESLTWNE